MGKKQRKKIFTWHIHGSYLFYLSQGEYDIYIPVNRKRDEGYYGRGLTFPFGLNVIEVEAEEVKNLNFDIILFQTDKNYLVDQYEILSPSQQKLPRIFLKHDPPHDNYASLVVKDPDILVVHVTYFNRLFWDNNGLETRVIMHGVTDSGVRWNGHLNKGIVVINHLEQRGRVIGSDIFKLVGKEIPLDIIGMGNEALGGKEILHPWLPEFIADYRFFFNPVRYSSLPLALCEAMMVGMPVVALSITELPLILKDGINGFIHNDPGYLISKMKLLLENQNIAAKIGVNARTTAENEFGIKRFINDWNAVFEEVTRKKPVDLQSY